MNSQEKDRLDSSISSLPMFNELVSASRPWEYCGTGEEREFWNEVEKRDALYEVLSRVRNIEYRNYVVRNILGQEIQCRSTPDGTERYWGLVSLGVMEDDFYLIRNINVSDSRVSIEGTCGFYGIGEEDVIKVTLHANGIKINAGVIHRDHIRPLGISMRVITFRGEIEIPSGVKTSCIDIIIEAGGKKLTYHNPKFDKFAPFSGQFINEYAVLGSYIVTHENNSICLEKLPKHFKYKAIMAKEAALAQELLQSGEESAVAAVKLRERAIRKRLKKKKQVWLICDRAESADDNGEAIFKYVSKNLSSKIDAYFVVRNASGDYERLLQFGNVVDFDSEQHKELALICDARISSQSHEVFRNPFMKEGYLYRDLLHAPLYVAEHGISYGKDFHSWFNRSNRMIDLVLVGAKPEYEMFTAEEYEFRENEVCVSGLPRFDYLEDHKEKLITIMPSWRAELADHWDNEQGRWILRSDFESSEYVEFYSSLMNDMRLNSAAKDYGYKLALKLHPIFKEAYDSFRLNKDVIIFDKEISYREIFARTALLVTDFSSVVYDFTYLNKPVIYAQFDVEEVKKGHTFKWCSDYDYDKDGFGEVETTLDEAVSRIIEYMRDDCRLKAEYLTRIAAFWDGTRDRNNTKRAVEGILKRNEEL